jgi:arabinan endo-1,5-alpha-L-arabinosidase
MKKFIFAFTLLLVFFKVGAQNCDTTLFPNGQQYFDTYYDIAGTVSQWKHFNTHDPTVNKQGEWYYMYSTDASWAGLNKNGAEKRRSKDLVNWQYLGNAFNGTPQSAQNFFKIHNPKYTDQGIWAPFLFKYKKGYILYYSAPGGLANTNYAFIGYATSDSASGPWLDHGMITSSYSNSDTINAIDPTVAYDSISHKLWMSYGSWAHGIFVLELDTVTGGNKDITLKNRGVKICNRANGGGQEGSEINYRNGWYYLFVSYDGLGDLYNVRVGRARTPNGPYYDFKGKGMASGTDNIPMVQAPYRFNNHPGWQGTGHCAVYNDNGKYYMFNQGRPGLQPVMFELHVRQIFWLNDWPVLSPERYAGVPQCSDITVDSLLGIWEHLPLIYHSSPNSDFHSYSDSVHLYTNGTFNADPSNTWTFNNDTLTLNWGNVSIQKLIVFWGWDWENSCRALLFTGMDQKGICIWGKKINQVEVERYNKLIDGATYTIRNGLSNMLLYAPDKVGTLIKQGKDNGLSSQLWKIKNAGEGYYYLLPQSRINLGQEVKNGSIANSTYIILDTLNGFDKQKFMITSSPIFGKANGFFHITTKVTNDASSVDNVSSTAEAAGMVQYKYTRGISQQWRFEKVDSIAIDTVSIDTFHVTGIEINKLQPIKVYPNPSLDGKITVDVSSLNDFNNIKISIADLKGIMVYKTSFNRPSVYRLDTKLARGVYIIRVSSNTHQYINKLIIQ